MKFSSLKCKELLTAPRANAFEQIIRLSFFYRIFLPECEFRHIEREAFVVKSFGSSRLAPAVRLIPAGAFCRHRRVRRRAPL